MRTLALDLEGTLISNAVSVIPRPGLFEFLECCNELFPRIAMFTTVPEVRYREIGNLLVAEGVAPGWFAALEYIHWSGRLKDLRFVNPTDPNSVLIVDDYPGYIRPQDHSNWVQIACFEHPYSDSDSELSEISRLLQELVSL